jgi:hypothetical protein
VGGGSSSITASEKELDSSSVRLVGSRVSNGGGVLITVVPELSVLFVGDDAS